jgi:hypothetical protein
MISGVISFSTAEVGVGSSAILSTWIVGTRISESSSLDWIPDGRGALDTTPTKVWTVAGLNDIPSSYTYS